MTGRTAIVIGDMDLVRPLGLAGIPVVVAGHHSPETGWSRYTHGHFDLPDLWEQPETGVTAIAEYAESLDHRPVLFYQSDASLMAISRYREILEPHVDVLLADADLIEALVDKGRFQRLAAELDLGVPEARIVKGGERFDDFESLGFPVVVKPAVRDRPMEKWKPLAGHAKSKSFASPEDLAEFLRDPHLAGAPMVVQRLIPGDEREIFSYHALIDNSGRTLGEFTGRKIRTWPLAYGQSTSVEVVENPSVAERGREILKSLEYSGVAKLDFKRDEDGFLHLLEINPRFSLWHHPGAVAGVNLPALAFHLLTNGPVQAPTTHANVAWCHAWDDVKAARAKGLSVPEWLRFVASCGSRRAGHLSDPGAMLGAVFYVTYVRPMARRRAAS